MLTKNELAREVEAETGVKPNLVKNVLDAVAVIAQDEISRGNDFSVPGLVRIAWSYTKPRKKGEMFKKGETKVGFGGIETVAEADSPARKPSVKLRAVPAAPIKAVAPKRDAEQQAAFLKTPAGKGITKRKG